MTLFGPDISSYEHGINVASLTDPFVMLKCTEGTYYHDADYPAWLLQAKASKKLVIAYHFCKAESSGAAQAANLKAHILDPSIPVMLDIETEGSSKPGLAKVLEIADAMKAVGLSVRLAYMPRWYWQEIGSPSLLPLAQRRIALVSSAYPNPADHDPVHDYLSSGGDHGAGWNGYGGMTPSIWQFTDAGLEQQKIDFNAFRGSVEQLVALLGAAPAVAEGIDVTPDEHNWLTNVYSGVFLGGPSCGRVVPAGQPGAGSNALFAHLDYMTSILEGINARPQVDVIALAGQIVSAIEQHLGSGADAQAVAVAVQAQLAQALGGHGAG